MMHAAFLALAFLTQHAAILQWNASPGAVYYRAYRSQPGSSWEIVPGCNLVANTACVDFTVSSGQTYLYAVQAIAPGPVLSAPSNVVAVTIP